MMRFFRKVSKRQWLIGIVVLISIVFTGVITSLIIDYYRQIKLQHTINTTQMILEADGVENVKKADLSRCTYHLTGFTQWKTCHRGFEFTIADVSKNEFESLMTEYDSALGKISTRDEPLKFGAPGVDNVGGAYYTNKYSTDGRCGLTYEYRADGLAVSATVSYVCGDDSWLSYRLNDLNLREKIQ